MLMRPNSFGRGVIPYVSAQPCVVRMLERGGEGQVERPNASLDEGRASSVHAERSVLFSKSRAQRWTGARRSAHHIDRRNGVTLRPCVTGELKTQEPAGAASRDPGGEDASNRGLGPGTPAPITTAFPAP